MDSALHEASEPPRPRFGPWIVVMRLAAWGCWIGGVLMFIWFEVPAGFPVAAKLIGTFYILFWAFIAGAILWTIAFILASVDQIRQNVRLAASAWSHSPGEAELK